MEKMRKVVLFLLLVLIAVPCRVGHSIETEDVPKVRIAIFKDIERFDVASKGTYQITNPQNSEIIEEGKRLKKTSVQVSLKGIQLDGKKFPITSLRITSNREISITLNHKTQSYRGRIDIVKNDIGEFFIINTLDLESYVKGVLYHEISHRWPLEAMKAQAIAVRTYALYQTKQNKKALYDVTSDIYSQVYGGRDAERFRTNVATNRTKNQVLIYNHKIFPAYFHSNSGGYTEDSREVWNQNIPPLRGGPDEYAQHSPAYFWRKNFRSRDVQSKLNQKGYKVGLIQDIKILEKNRSGRIKKVEIFSRDAKSVVISGKDFREIMGPNEVRSNMYEIEMKGYFFDMIGRGWGHGVGMCQWGAHEMAKRQFSFVEILDYYYPGSQIKPYEQSFLF